MNYSELFAAVDEINRTPSPNRIDVWILKAQIEGAVEIQEITESQADALRELLSHD